MNFYIYTTLVFLCAIPHPTAAQCPGFELREFKARDFQECRMHPIKWPKGDHPFWEGYSLGEPMAVGDSDWIIDILGKSHIVPDDSPDAGHRLKLEWGVAERMIVVDRKTGSVRQLTCQPDAAGQEYEFSRHFPWGAESVGLYVRPLALPADKRKILKDQDIKAKTTLWKWNLRTNAIVRPDQSLQSWRLLEKIDSEECTIDETELAKGTIRLINTRTRKSVKIPVDPEFNKRMYWFFWDSSEQYFAPGAGKSAVISCWLRKESVLDCYDTEREKSPAWTISEKTFRDAVGGGELEHIVPLKGASRPCAQLPLIVKCARGDDVYYHIILVDTKDGQIAKVVKVGDLPPVSQFPCVSPDGRWVVADLFQPLFKNGRPVMIAKGVQDRGIWFQLVDLRSGQTRIDNSEGDRGERGDRGHEDLVAVTNQQVVVITDGESIIWTEDAQAKWATKVLFELLPSETD